MFMCSSCVCARTHTRLFLSTPPPTRPPSLSPPYLFLPISLSFSLSLCLCLCSNLLSQQEAEDLLRDSEDMYASAKSQYERPSSSASVFRPVDYWVRLSDHLCFNFMYTCVGMLCATVHASRCVCVARGVMSYRHTHEQMHESTNPPPCACVHTHARTHT